MCFGVFKYTCGARCVDVESCASDVDVGPKVPRQRLIRGLRDLVGQRVDALHAALVRQEIHTDPLLSQRR